MPDDRVTIVRSVSELRSALSRPRHADARIGLVPTMGAFHEGHLSLMRRARAECDVVVVSLFVNPKQFGAGEDLAAYPRDERRDARLAQEQGVDLLFAPPPEAVYPPGFATTVRVEGLTDVLEGAWRPGHFDGVATVVAKLLGMVAPQRAYFGQKDAQQLLVVRRLARDLDIPVEIVACPTVREPDGVAMSSRNAYLGPRDRERAVALRRGLGAAERALAAGERDRAAVSELARAAMAEHDVEPEYLAFVDPETFAIFERLPDERGREVLVVVAAQVGPARLIDNMLLRVGGARPQRVTIPEEAPCSA